MIFGACFLCLASACQASFGSTQPTDQPVSTNTRLALPPTWTPAPRQEITSAPATPWPTATRFVDADTATPTVDISISPTPDPILAALPAGAIPLRSQGWTISTHPENLAAALPYEMPDGTLGLALVDDHQRGVDVSWMWQQETAAASMNWQKIRRLTRTLDEYLLLFLAQDVAGQWYAGAVTLPQDDRQLVGLIPLSDPQNAYLTTTRFDGLPWQFWLVENGMLRLYQWQSNTAALLWELPDASQNALTVGMDPTTDITADGWPELWLRWWPWEAKERWISAITWQQFFVSAWPGYSLIADLPPKLQFQDVDNDGVGEFLLPDPPERPERWLVYNWYGDQFINDLTLDFPSSPAPQVPKLSQLPSLGADLYFQQSDGRYLWPKAGGEPQAVDTPPETSACDATAITQEVVSWGPNCVYAVIKQPAPSEGYTLGLLNVSGGWVVEIPNTLTYLRGHSTFGWDAFGQYLLHARAGTNPGLYRIWLASGLTEPVFTLSAIDDDPFGVTDPFIFADGSLGFAIQGTARRHYPPFGVYRRSANGDWNMLAELPPLSGGVESTHYGSLLWSPDGSQFLFHAPYFGEEQPPYGTLLIGSADSSILLDINSMLGKASNFMWQ